jgi:hypothetical protein
MGSNLFFPFTRERFPGLRLFHSGHPVANFTTFWLAVSIIAFNLNRYTPGSRVWDVGGLEFFLWVFVLPMAVVHMARIIFKRPEKVDEKDFGDLQDIVDEAGEELGGV